MQIKTANHFDQLVTSIPISLEQIPSLEKFIEEMNQIAETPGRILQSSFEQINKYQKVFLVSKLGKIIDNKLRLESYLAEPDPSLNGNEPYVVSRLAHIPADFCTGNYFGKLQLMHERHIIRLQRFLEKKS